MFFNIIFLYFSISYALAERKWCFGLEDEFEDVELEAILQEEPCQTQEVLADALGVDHSTVSIRLKAMGMISKQGNWVPYELKSRDVERVILTCELLLARSKRFFYIVTGEEKWIHYDNLKCKKSYGYILATHQHRPQSKATFMARSRCCVQGGTSLV